MVLRLNGIYLPANATITYNLNHFSSFVQKKILAGNTKFCRNKGVFCSELITSRSILIFYCNIRKSDQ
ncbi:hypothetical protein AHMF7605_16940 [Adhaeribacter arboris]|uniref:Uncharacterized protein n=1 Tax=Adhaeribacter arboris TaxID=2072846 RepID=A0A2T2YHX0_9BACT|nr:hypothetical protein AHMF7605_16940 [Adhaeribacter arboris]